ncbi:MAG: efflux RND transporter periplasmic adaptor subunit, partial [Lentisphaerae bacterium]|nr:efflux RND transporter periplasmic adaptor subunit [Lentisphaerota bacterium]
AWVRDGQAVEITTEAYPGRLFTGTVAFVEPVLNERTRTVRVPAA